MENNIEIKICLGSSCFSRGNKQSVHIIKEYLTKNKLEDAVGFSGAHCFGDCSDGPILKINETIYKNVEPTDIKSILDEFFNLTT